MRSEAAKHIEGFLIKNNIKFDFKIMKLRNMVVINFVKIAIERYRVH